MKRKSNQRNTELYNKGQSLWLAEGEGKRGNLASSKDNNVILSDVHMEKWSSLYIQYIPQEKKKE